MPTSVQAPLQAFPGVCCIGAVKTPHRQPSRLAQKEMAEFDAWYVFGVDKVINTLEVARLAQSVQFLIACRNRLPERFPERLPMELSVRQLAQVRCEVHIAQSRLHPL